ncbi:sensor histidine kinase [Clostridium sp. UBA4548]|uniref:sensor histidine kinase n=1 Tax=Clostridium sp. UBA4548 TaxID=1946361 RepID=UPI0025B7C79C|nr:sensor histidine kinase [Clostridium sp. UBA4548]
MNEIKELCLKHTNLKETDIEIIQHIARTIQFIADSTESDVFIDCPTTHNDAAIVVAEAKPTNKTSLYKESVVGKLAIRQNEPAVIRAIEIGMPGRNIKGITQEQIKVKQSVEPIRNKENRTIGILIIEKDVTEDLCNDRKIEILAEANEELTTQIAGKYEKESDITYYVNEAILIFDENGTLKFKNPGADLLYSKLGYNEDILGMNFSNLSVTNKPFKNIISSCCIDTFEHEVGGMCLQVKYIVQSNKALKLVVLIRDITDMKEKEKELVHKSVVIREIHHRVKNNLQTIASLLRLQSRRIDNEAFLNAMNDSINRILSIAATHEILAKQGIDEVNIKEVINRIKSSMVTFEKRDNIDLAIKITGDDFRISSDKATTTALVVNELLQNSIKHAFRGKSQGEIIINIEKGNMYSTISIIDNGNGFQVETVPKNSLGLMIVRSLIHDKLEGNLDIFSNSEGTKVVFDFKN